MGMTYGFCDDMEYDASDVNRVFAMMFTDGVMPYKTNVTQDITGCVAAITEGGVKGETMQLSVVDGKVKIGEGAALFSDGSWVVVDADGEIVPGSIAAEQYIGLKKSIGTGKVMAIWSQTKETDDGNYKYIWLGKTDTSGQIINDAKHAITTLVANSGNIYTSRSLNVQVGNTEKNYIVDVGQSGFRYIIFKNSERNDFYQCVVIDLETENSYGDRIGNNRNVSLKGLTVSGSTLTLSVKVYGTGSTSDTVYFIAM